MQNKVLFAVLAAGVICASQVGQLNAATPDNPDRYNVVWTTPSEDCHGSMPLGNGDIALNVWVERGGDLQFYIGKTDAWDDNARLLKVGKVRVHLAPSPFASGLPFRQELSLTDATIKIQTGTGREKTSVQIWVDANQPVVHVVVESAKACEATASFELWRTNQYEVEPQVSDVLLERGAPNNHHAPTLVEPDTILSGLSDRIGWLHHNKKSVGPQLLADIQGIAGFKQEDPLLHRTFGGIITATRAQRVDDAHLRSPKSASHRFNVFVLTRHPSSPERWLADAKELIQRVESKSSSVRRKEHEQWWGEFWERSWIHASANSKAKPSFAEIVPTNRHSVRIGFDQHGENQFAGELGRLSLMAKPLSETEIAALARLDRRQCPNSRPEVLFSSLNVRPQSLTNTAAWDFPNGFTFEGWVKPQKSDGARIVDKITPGGHDGFLFDIFPKNTLRVICGEHILQGKDALPEGRWTHVAAVADPAAGGCRLYVNGKLVADGAGAFVRDEAVYTSQIYHLQRFITACAGRGAFPIKFNGSLFTVPPRDLPYDPDYRKWGPGYWWQNTRLPYESACASGDFDLMQPLFRLYSGEMLDLSKYRTRLYCGHDGAFIPECMVFWGAMFSTVYGWEPFAQRTDKLQENGCHKYAWVGGLELCAFMLDYYEHTLDKDFLRKTALPFSCEILTFFEEQYPTNAQGQLVMYPSQAVETWWECTNAMPELAGLHAVTERLLGLPAADAPAQHRQLWQRLHAKLPSLPLREVDGQLALAPGKTFANKRNSENPELYAVFPFRLIALGRPNLDWGINALQHRWDKGSSGWRQDDIFMAYLGLTDEARRYVVARARKHDPNERFPAFWGPNYDWTPDQDHGGILMKAFQAMLMQTDGRKILLFPAWPKDWDVEFKLHAPYQTTVEGVYRGGKVKSLRVTPKSRRGDVELIGARNHFSGVGLPNEEPLAAER